VNWVLSRLQYIRASSILRKGLKQRAIARITTLSSFLIMRMEEE
jgi:hypothetical protein